MGVVTRGQDGGDVDQMVAGLPEPVGELEPTVSLDEVSLGVSGHAGPPEGRGYWKCPDGQQ